MAKREIIALNEDFGAADEAQLEAAQTTDTYVLPRDTYSTTGVFVSEIADGATAVGFVLDTDNDLATAGAKLLSLRNFGTEKFSIDNDGRIKSHGYYRQLGFGGSALGDNKQGEARLEWGANFSHLLHLRKYPTADKGLSITSDSPWSLGARTEPFANVIAESIVLDNSYTDTTNYETGGIAWNSNVLELKTEAAGTGVARDLAISPAGLLLFLNLPTSDPGVANAAWLDAGHLAISAG